jgi:hypothetical protein
LAVHDRVLAHNLPNVAKYGRVPKSGAYRRSQSIFSR